MISHRMPMTIGQQGLWYLSQIDASVNAAYNVVLALETAHALDPALLGQALNTVVAHHAQLCARIVVADFVPALESQQNVTVPLRQVNGTLVEVARTESYTPIDLNHAPLCRATLVDDTGAGRHGLAISVPHVVFDGPSASVFLDQLSSTYTALASGAEPAALEITAWGSQAQVAVERDYLASETGRRRLEEAVEQLLALSAAPVFPMRAQAQPGHVFLASTVETTLPAELGARVQAYARAEGLSAAAVYLGALQILLWQHSGRAEFGISLPVSCRDTEAAQYAVGYFTNFAVLRAQLDGGATTSSLLDAVSDELFAVLDSRHLPYPELVRAYKKRGGEPLSGDGMVGFNYQRIERTSWYFGGVLARNIVVPPHFTKDRLKFEVEDGAHGVRCALDFDRDAFAPEFLQAALARYADLLRAMLDQREATLNALPRCSAAELQRLLNDWNGAPAVSVTAVPVTALFEARVRQAPDSVALVAGAEQLSYQQLNQRANRLARQLRSAGARPDSVIAVCVKRGADAVVALLAVLKSGAAYLPLDPADPASRREYALRDAGCSVLVTQSAILAQFNMGGITPLAIDAPNPSSPDEEATDLAPISQGDNIAYCIYTSGSTGTPKGVAVPAAALSAHVQTCIALYQLAPADRVLQYASTSFDASIEQMLAPLCAGATLVVRPPELWSPQELLQVVRDQALTVADIPAVYWHHYATTNDLNVDFGALRLMIVGGEPIKTSSYPAAANSIRVLNAYGPTEATITASVGELTAAACKQNGQYAPIGRPLGDTRIYVVDDALQLVPPGVIGELCIAGPRLARAYLNRPDLTAASFVPDPFGRAGTRMYRTGDLGRHLPDGTLQFIGRRDQQVKLRGFRIELGEVESALLACVGVREAVVLDVDDARDNKQLIAYIVCDGGQAASAVLQQQLAARLPAYMVPTAWFVLDRLPLNAGGKVDVEDNFFVLGGHSLLATQIIARIAEKLQVKLPLRTLLDAPTVAGLARRIEQMSQKVKANQE
jgi:amino acid adenylation domain-containing protein